MARHLNVTLSMANKLRLKKITIKGYVVNRSKNG